MFYLHNIHVQNLKDEPTKKLSLQYLINTKDTQMPHLIQQIYIIEICNFDHA